MANQSDDIENIKRLIHKALEQRIRPNDPNAPINALLEVAALSQCMDILTRGAVRDSSSANR